MDKYFIQNAFKTLDEIEAEMAQNKKPLAESLSEDTTAIEEPIDKDEFEDKYLGKMAIIGGNGKFKGNAVQITKLIDFNGDFNNSVWEAVTEDGLKLTLAGDELEVKLEEKLPRDLAKAYSRVTNWNYDGLLKKKGEDTSDVAKRAAKHFPIKNLRRKTAIDFENSNYKDVTNEDRAAIIKEYKKKKDQLRLLYNTDYGHEQVLMMWDTDGNFLTSPSELKNNVFKFHDGDLSIYSFKDLITAADKIYVTDENEHTLDVPGTTTVDTMTPEQKADWEIINKGNQMTDYWGSNPYKDKNKAAAKLLDKAASALNTDYKHQLKGYDIPDTGKHKDDPYEHRELVGSSSRYAKYIQRTDINPNDIQWYKDRLNQLQWNYNDEKAKNRYYYSQKINHDLAKLIILKGYAEKLRQEYKSKRDAAEKSTDYDIQSTTWVRLNEEKETLEARIKQLTDNLLKYQQQLADVNNKLTPEVKEEFEELIDSKLDDISTKYEDVVAQLEKITSKIKKKPVKEDLEESHLRIYTRDFDGKEDFVDDFDTLDEGKERFHELVDSGNFELVCLVSISKDNVEVICDSSELEEISDGVEPEKLTEGKAFNLRDSNDVIDAQTYKAVGEQSDETLVVVDPSVESLDDVFEPHAGDAILQCPECKTTFFLSSNKLEKDTDSDRYNIEMPCPHCGAKGGFDYLYQAADKDNGKEVEEKEEVSEKEIKEPETETTEDKLEPVEDDLVDVDDVDEIKEESFEKLINPYLTKLYENVNGFKVTNISMPYHNQIVIEGNLQGSNGKEKLVEFVFNATKKQNGKVILEGFNTKLTDDSKKAYTLTANIDGNKLTFESLNYNYTKTIGGENILIEGVEK